MIVEFVVHLFKVTRILKRNSAKRLLCLYDNFVISNKDFKTNLAKRCLRLSYVTRVSKTKIKQEDRCVRIKNLIKVTKISKRNFAKPPLRLFYNFIVSDKSFKTKFGEMITASVLSKVTKISKGLLTKQFFRFFYNFIKNIKNFETKLGETIFAFVLPCNKNIKTKICKTIVASVQRPWSVLQL